MILSPDKKSLYAADQNSIRKWDLKTMAPLYSIFPETRIYGGIALSPDEKYIYSGSGDGPIDIWDLKTKTLFKSLEFRAGPIQALAISKDGNTLYSAAHTVGVWDLKKRKFKWDLSQDQNPVPSLKISHDESTLFIGSERDAIAAWNIKNIGKKNYHPVTIKEDLKKGALSLEISPDGKELYSGNSYDDAIDIWDLTKNELSFKLRGHKEKVGVLALSSDGKILFSSAWGEIIRVWNIKTRKLIRTIEETQDNITSLLVSPDRKTLYIGTFLGPIIILDLERLGLTSKTVEKK
jgi:WD40 repeat protein